jgi:hypothetical protein
MAEETKDADKPPKHETTKPAEPVDDVVSTKHQLQVGKQTLRYTATTGRVVLRDEVYEDGTFSGYQAKAEISLTRSRSTVARAAPASGCTSACWVRAAS